MPRRVSYRAACGLAAVVAAVCAVLAGESPAGAAPKPHAQGAHAQGTQRAPQVRDIRRTRLIRNVRKPAAGEGGKRARPTGRPAAKPWSLDIPAIGVSIGLMKLGGPAIAPGGLSLPTPPLAKASSDAGWYRFSSVPGAAGNAVIVGHVDTYVGPGAFYNLYQLRRGDAIYVNADGARQRFDVTSAREVAKPAFPASQVFGGTEKHMLWLITCGGAFDYRTRHYLDNIVVSATWHPAGGRHRGTPNKSHEKHSGNQR